MPAYRNISDFCPKDTYKLTRNVPSTPNDSPITDAWWTVKNDPELPDDTAIFSLHITPTESPSGIVSNYEDLSGQLAFIAVPDDSAAMTNLTSYYYDIQIKLVSGEVYTVEVGKLFTLRTVTQV